MNSIGAYNYSKNKVIINGHENVSAPAKISQCLVLDEFIILLLDADELGSDANVYCYDIRGIARWVIPQPDLVHERNYYTSIYVRSDLYLYAYNISGIEVKLDYNNGQILRTALIK
ncbi:MAG: hypothetical protein ACXVB0_05385 [Mucilaginibacter sp.]